jgi:hypothetical protein
MMLYLRNGWFGQLFSAPALEAAVRMCETRTVFVPASITAAYYTLLFGIRRRLNIFGMLRMSNMH